MRQHYLRGLPFLVSKIYYFEVRCSFVAIKILLCRSREMKQGCRLARFFGKSIMDFYARNQYFLMNTQPMQPVNVKILNRRPFNIPARSYPPQSVTAFRL